MDELLTIKSVLSTNWLSANTDNITPTFDIIVNQKILDLANNDYILLYFINTPVQPYGMGGTSWFENNMISIDIRTTYKNAAITDIRAHAIKLRDEVKRIIKTNISYPSSTIQLMLIERIMDLSDKNIGIARFVFNVQLKHYGS